MIPAWVDLDVLETPTDLTTSLEYVIPICLDFSMHINQNMNINSHRSGLMCRLYMVYNYAMTLVSSSSRATHQFGYRFPSKFISQLIA